MLVIRFFDFDQKHVFQTKRFPNRQIHAKMRCASAILTLRPEIGGYMIYEVIGNDLIPYHPFNGQPRYERGKTIRL